MEAAANKRILLLDKDNEILDLVDDIMFYGYSDIHITGDSRTLRDLARNCRPDLIILDFLMANMDNGALCRQIKQDDGLKDIPLVVVAPHRHIKSNVGRYCDALLMKPASGEELATQISYLVAS